MNIEAFFLANFCEIDLGSIDALYESIRKQYADTLLKLASNTIKENDPDFDEWCNYVDQVTDYAESNKRTGLMQCVTGIHSTAEIAIKNIIETAYSPTDEELSKMFRWESLCKYLKSKSLEPKSFSSYITFNELRELSNTIKHHGKIKTNSPLINMGPKWPEGIIPPSLLDSEYKRLKNGAASFHKELKSEVMRNLLKGP